MKKIELTEKARFQIVDINYWYENKQIGLGKRFLNELDDTFRLIPKSPALSPKIDENVRRKVMNNFPYLIYYSIEKDYILILSIIHGMRHPSAWEKSFDS